MKADIFNLGITDGNFTKDSLKYMYINLTNKCNLRCLYCYDENSKENMQSVDIPLEVYEKVAEDCKKLGLQRVCLTGGELFLNKNWFEIGKFFKERGMLVTMSSNGTLVTEDIIAKMKILGADVQVSLDGDEDTMKFVTCRDYAYEKIMQTLQLFKEHNIDVALNAVVGKHNRDNVEFLNKFSKEKEIPIRISLYNNVFNDSNGKIVPLEIEEVADLIKEVSEMRKTNEYIFMSLPPLLTPEGMPLRVNPGCGWVYFLCGILHNGNVTVCPLASGCSDLVAGNVLEQPFAEIWTNSAVFKKLRTYSYQDVKGICADCPVLDLCMGYCRLDPHVRNNDMLAPSYLCQRYYEAMVDGRIKDKVFPSGMLEIS